MKRGLLVFLVLGGAGQLWGMANDPIAMANMADKNLTRLEEELTQLIDQNRKLETDYLELQEQYTGAEKEMVKADADFAQQMQTAERYTGTRDTVGVTLDVNQQYAEGFHKDFNALKQRYEQAKSSYIAYMGAKARLEQEIKDETTKYTGFYNQIPDTEVGVRDKKRFKHEPSLQASQIQPPQQQAQQQPQQQLQQKHQVPAPAAKQPKKPAWYQFSLTAGQKKILAGATIAATVLIVAGALYGSLKLYQKHQIARFVKIHYGKELRDFNPAQRDMMAAAFFAARKVPGAFWYLKSLVNKYHLNSDQIPADLMWQILAELYYQTSVNEAMIKKFKSELL